MAIGGYKEIKGKRSVFGKIVVVLFIGFNMLMALWLVMGLGAVSEGFHQMSEAEKTGTTIGAGIGTMMIFVFWALGDVVLGLPLLLTRPAKAMVPVEEED